MTDEKMQEVIELINKLADACDIDIFVAFEDSDRQDEQIKFTGNLCPVCICNMLNEMAKQGMIKHQIEGAEHLVGLDESIKVDGKDADSVKAKPLTVNKKYNVH